MKTMYDNYVIIIIVAIHILSGFIVKCMQLRLLPTIVCKCTIGQYIRVVIATYS